MPSQDQNIICTLLKKDYGLLVYIYTYRVTSYSVNNFSLCILFSVKFKLCSGLEKAWGLSALLMLISTSFELELVNYFNYVCFESSRIFTVYRRICCKPKLQNGVIQLELDGLVPF